jgi:DNA-binding CsgD family transcriptional regulator
MVKWHDPFNKYKPRRKWPMMPRQKMILHLYNAKLKTHEVAEVMGVTRHTLYKHLDRIYYKLDVSNRDEAIQKGVKT